MRRIKNPKAKGANYERKIKRYLMERGWFVVRQAASAFPDLISIPPKGEGKLTFCEVKWDLKNITSEEIETLIDLSKKHDARSIIMFKKGAKYIEKAAMKHDLGMIIHADSLKILKGGRKNSTLE